MAKAKKKSLKKKATVAGRKTKSTAKKIGRKVKKTAKTDVGRAGIGAGAGALLLGPIGAVAGAGVAMATKKKKKSKGAKRNPEPMATVSTTMGTLLLDYHRVSENVEHVAASALRGQKVELSILKKARNDLRRAAKEQPIKSEREQIGNLVNALTRIVDRYSGERKKNPVRAFSLETEIKRGRQKKVRGAAMRATSASLAATDAKRLSLRRRLAKVNPSHHARELARYSRELKGMSMDELEKEHRAISSLISRAKRHPKTSRRMSEDLEIIREEIKAQKRLNRSSNPGRKKNPVSSGMITDRTLDQLAKKYRTRRNRHLTLITSPGSTPGEVARAKKAVDDAESQLILYAEVRNMDPLELQRFMEAAEKKRRTAVSKRKSNPSTPSSTNESKALKIAYEIPDLGTLGRYPRAVRLWETIYIKNRYRGIGKERSSKAAWDAVKKEGYRVDSKGIWRMPSRRFNPGNHPKDNPLKLIPKGASERVVRSTISKNIASEMDAGKPQKQAVAIALSQARRDAPRVMAKIYGAAPNPSKLKAEGFDYETGNHLDVKKKMEMERTARSRKSTTPPTSPVSKVRKKKSRLAVSATRKKKKDNPKLPHTGTLPKAAMPMFKTVFNESYEYYRKKRKATKSKAEEIAARTAWDETGRYWRKSGGKWIKRKSPLPQVDRPHDVKLKTKPKRPRAQPTVPRYNPGKKSTPQWQRLIKRCHRLWDAYCDKPTKKNLKAIFIHLEKMGESRSKKVKSERTSCLRVANKEAKRLGMK